MLGRAICQTSDRSQQWGLIYTVNTSCVLKSALLSLCNQMHTCENVCECVCVWKREFSCQHASLSPSCPVNLSLLVLSIPWCRTWGVRKASLPLPSPPSSSCLCPSFLSCKCQTDSLCTIIRHTVNISPPHQIECPVQASYSVTIWHPSSISWSSCVWHLQF